MTARGPGAARAGGGARRHCRMGLRYRGTSSKSFWRGHEKRKARCCRCLYSPGFEEYSVPLQGIVLRVDAQGVRFCVQGLCSRFRVYASCLGVRVYHRDGWHGSNCKSLSFSLAQSARKLMSIASSPLKGPVTRTPKDGTLHSDPCTMNPDP